MGGLKQNMRSIFNRVRSTYLATKFERCGQNCQFAVGASYEYANQISLADNVRIARGALLRANSCSAKALQIGNDCSLLEQTALCCNDGSIRLGDRVWLGQQTLVFGNGGVDIGNDVLIAPHCCINTVSHGFSRTDIPINAQPLSRAPITIEDDVWLGIGVCILQGVTIGKGCIVGAHSLVNKDLPAGSIVHGSPARVVTTRFDKQAAA